MTNVFGEADLLIWEKVHLALVPILESEMYIICICTLFVSPDKRQDPGEKDDGYVHGNTNARERSEEVHVPSQVLSHSCHLDPPVVKVSLLHWWVISISGNIPSLVQLGWEAEKGGHLQELFSSRPPTDTDTDPLTLTLPSSF